MGAVEWLGIRGGQIGEKACRSPCDAPLSAGTRKKMIHSRPAATPPRVYTRGYQYAALRAPNIGRRTRRTGPGPHMASISGAVWRLWWRAKPIRHP